MLGFDSWLHMGLVLITAIAAGAANTIAGGGTILSFPVLVWLGLPPVQANATSTVGLWSGSAGGAVSYYPRLRTLDPSWRWLFVPALAGGAFGAWLLVSMPASWFASIAPVMVIGASALVALEPLLRRHIVFEEGQAGRRAGLLRLVGVLTISAYGGYFGAGLGILVLVALALLGMDNLHDANALKNLLVMGIKGAAVVYFIVLQVLDWPVAILMILGSVAGGWTGGFLVREVEPGTLRWLIVAIGVTMGLIMVVRTYF